MRLSIVIAAWNGSTSLRRCLISLVNQLDPEDSEVIVASNFSSDGVQDLLQSVSFLHFISLPSVSTVPELRTRGIERASGDVIALLEDHCTVDEAWAAQMRKAHKLSYSVIGGSVENVRGASPLNWAVYFYDYGPYMLPDVPRVAKSLTGCNISYKTRVLHEVRDRYRNGFHETFINQELQRRGYELYLLPSAMAYHNKKYRLKSSIGESYHHGRLFGALRVSDASFNERAYRVATSLFLPVLLPSRIVLRTFRKKNHVKELVIAFPYLLLLIGAWSYGEFCGYVRRERRNPRK